MVVLSLFDGMSCGQLALQQACVPVDLYLASEVDTHAIKVTQHNFPATIQLGDVQDIDPGTLPPVDLLIGGSPCQSFSFAGKQEGMQTTERHKIEDLDTYLFYKDVLEFDFVGQSYLFWEYMRLQVALNPKFFLLENVKMQKQWEKVITNAVGVAPVKINSKHFTAQNRERLYWTNIPIHTFDKNKGYKMADFWCDSVNITDRFFAKEPGTLAHTKAWSALRTLDDLCKCLTTGGQNISNSGATNVEIGGEIFAPGINTVEALQTVPLFYTDVSGVSKTQRHRMLGNGWTIDVIAHIFRGLPCQNQNVA